MTTFVDPLGITASSKTGIVALNVDSTTGTTIPRDCGWMVAVLTPTDFGARVNLPSGAELGDMVEIHVLQSAFNPTVRVYAPSGETIDGLTNEDTTVRQGRIFRKVDTSLWVAVGP
ncbi:hypothetical protein [Bradyrhizobium elkanii]|jgi:hypothetical protein|uniref:hypothetical protein n=1 Tax=Bradyrhizobium elkanii TaxID=29448 RepID=UPI0012FDFD27|nr:hypothetical protein [Bradyrhizobium elkanii]